MNSPEPQESATAVASLRDAIEAPLDPNDLGRLAQMHTDCQTLAALGGAAGQLASAVADFLEHTILEEAADTKLGLQIIPQAIELISRAIAGEPVASQPLAARITAAASPLPAESESASAASAAGVRSTVDTTDDSEPLKVDPSERDHLAGFIDESREHLDTIEAVLLDVERDPTNTSKINELFRPFHTIKGIAGFLNLRDISQLMHEAETILDLARNNELTITAETIDVIFAAVDVLKTQVAELANYVAKPIGDSVPQPDVTMILARLRAAACGTAPIPGTASNGSSSPAPSARHRSPSAGSGGTERSGESSGTQTAETSIRVDTTKLDFLVDAVGELVIAQTMVNQSDAIRRDEKLRSDISQVTKIVRDVQEAAMAMRMVPIGHTFRKMRRLVRDASRKAGKQVELQISGEDTELDKHVIQAISDPFVHMVRNAVDHGIEPPAERIAAGKPEVGTVRLNAFHQAGSIVIEIRDDGRGLDREKLIAKGIERGLVSPGEQLTDQQAYSLILQPGYSTADVLTDVSGRGVGMDVVKRNIEHLRGRIEIASDRGRGSCFTIRLPLTLAIIDGMLVRVGAQRLIIPTILIERSLRPAPGQITVVQRRGTMIRVRGELIALVQLGSLFGFSKPLDPTQGLVVIAQTEAQKVGIVVDQLIGQQQVVIKTLGERFKHVRGVSGAAVLGDGHVGLIIEPTGVLTLHNSGAGGGAGDLTQPSNAATPADREASIESRQGQPTPRLVSEQGADALAATV